MEKVTRNVLDLSKTDWDNTEMTIIMRAWESIDKLVLIAKVHGTEQGTYRENNQSGTKHAAGEALRNS